MPQALRLQFLSETWRVSQCVIAYEGGSGDGSK